MRLKARTFVGLLTTCFALNACRSKGIDVTIQNNAPVPIRNVEIDYPGAAFGAPVISPGKSYWYHIKPSGDGEISVSFEMDNGKTFRQKGPAVQAGKSDKLLLIVEQDAKQQWRMRAEVATQP